MLEFDEKTKLLSAYCIPYQKQDYKYHLDDMKVSYNKYLSSSNGLHSDLIELVDALNIAASGKNADGEANSQIFELKSFRLTNDSGVLGITSPSIGVWVTLRAIHYGKDLPEFKLMSLPYMQDCGVLEYRKRKYALIREMVQDYDVTLVTIKGRNAIKVITDTGNYVDVKNNPVKPKTRSDGNDINFINVIYGLAESEGLDKDRIEDVLVSPAFSKMFSEKQQSVSVNKVYGYAKSSGYINNIKSERYAVTKVRSALNEALSIDRAEGKVLSRDVERDGKILCRAGKVVTPILLKQLKFHHVNEVYVRSTPMYNGWYLASAITINYLRYGTKLIPQLKDRLECVGITGDYISEDTIFRMGEKPNGNEHDGYVYVNEPVIIPQGTEVSEDLMNLLIYNDFKEVKLIDKEAATSNSNKWTVVPLEVSIVGNRHYKATDLNLDPNKYGEWVYIYGEAGNEQIKPAQDRLCTYDYIALLSLYDRVYIGEDLDRLASGDLGFRKRLNQTGELFSIAMKRAMVQFFRKYARSFRGIDEGPDLFTDNGVMEQKFIAFESTWWSMLGANGLKVVTEIDRTNPMSFYSSLQKVKSIFKDKNGIPEAAHSMVMGHYGRLCPYETPSGKSLGITLNKAVRCRIEDGVMRTPYHPVIKNNKTGYVSIDFLQEHIRYLTVKEEENYKIADIRSLDFDVHTGEVFTRERVLARVPSFGDVEKQTVMYVDVNQIDYVNIDPNQTDSLVATTIPFQGADDSARVVFETSMCKQAKGLLNSEIPIVGTSAFYDTPYLSSYYMIFAEGEGTVQEVLHSMVVVEYENGDEKTYNFDVVEYSRDSLIVRVVNVEVGQHVKPGDVLVSSNFVQDGVMATGYNALVAFVPKGVNYEDGVLAAERLGQSLKSYGTKPCSIPISKANPVGVLSKIAYNRYITPDSVMFKMRRGNAGKVSSSETVAVKADGKQKGFIISVSKEYDVHEKRETKILINSVSIDPLHEGDKMANRHGNKGVAPKITSNDQMLQFDNGEFVDITYNPAGVASRMNIGQILECNLGLVCYILGIRARSDSFNGASTREIKLLLQFVWDLANKEDIEAVLSLPKYDEIPQKLKNYCRANIGRIKAWEGSFNADGTAWLYNPRTGKMLEQPAVVGINYVYKLIHESVKKIQARAGLCTETYVEKTASPTHGISKHGGQRYGFMELDALAAYGASHLLHELLNERGDNKIARNNFTVERLHKGNGYMLDEKYAIRRSTEEFVASLKALGVGVDFEGVLPNDTREEVSHRDTYRVETLLKAVDDDIARNSTVISAEELLDDIL